MIGWICFVLMVSGTICAVVTGNMDAVTESILSTPFDTISLLLKIGGSICFFSGLMKVAEASGIVDKFSLALARPIGFLMPKTKQDPSLRSAVSLNLASNFFGLGNAATPYGIKASGLMSDGAMSRSLATFLILNTCSVQFIPTTICALRQANGSQNAMDILPAVWIVQILSCTIGIVLVRCFFREAK